MTYWLPDMQTGCGCSIDFLTELVTCWLPDLMTSYGDSPTY